jgi:hypothetical protein
VNRHQYIRLWAAPFGSAAGWARVRGLSGNDLLRLQENVARQRTVLMARNLLASILVNLEGVACADELVWGDLERLLLATYAETFCATPEVIADCPECGTYCEHRLDIKSMLGTEPDLADPRYPLNGEADGWVATLRELRVADLIAVIDEGDVAHRMARLFAMSVVELRDPAGTVVDVTVCPTAVVSAIDEALAELNAAGLILIASTCPNCGCELSCRLDPFALLLREAERSRDIWVDVAQLAKAFGWRAPEILALPDRHRRRLLKLTENGVAV